MESLISSLPPVRGRLLPGERLAPFTWFRVGGEAEVLFIPADVEDLASFLRALPSDVPVYPIGVGSNLIVRDGGVPGVVVRLAGREFGAVVIDGDRVVAGSGALDATVARAAAKAGLSGLEFLVGIPGTIGGALTMNAGCYGRETKDVLEAAWGVDRTGEVRRYAASDFGFRYRHSDPTGIIWIQAVFRGQPDDPAAIEARMNEISSRREAAQPIREKTGGSTFANPDPPGAPDARSAWKLVDEAGMRGARRGGAQVSEQHCNFLINTGDATAADIEGLGEDVRAAVKATSGVDLRWEIRRIGRR
ncbi:MAG: UDP-N-acetylmuramate dehydrogenase [Alphaproteobacteria bacterium]|nr:UDP-N-acetylmuramate dehydrogenase [Alphaproteobacteria bacterium]